MIIAITGSIGSGKTTFAEIFKKLGCVLISADKIGYEVLKKKEVKEALKATFGEEVFNSKDQVIKKRLAEKAFIDEKSHKKLNKITHPLLKDILAKRVKKYKNRTVIVDVALYDELDVAELCDITVLVKASKEKVNKRIKNKEFLIRKRFQKTIKRADHTVLNDGSIKELEKKAKSILRR